MDDQLFLFLKREFSAEDNTFLIKLRPGYTWDNDAFQLLARAMYACCEQMAEEKYFPRWLAEGFWRVPDLVKDWVDHYLTLVKHKEYAEEYLKACCQDLYDVAYYFFNGEDIVKERKSFPTYVDYDKLS